jgi:hypothetical protein
MVKIKNMKTNIIVLIILLLNVLSCEKINESDDVLTLQKQNYFGSDLLLNGIYFTVKENFEGSYYQRYALYRNGIIRDLGAAIEIDSPDILTGNSKADWGVFQIYSNEIKFEKWYPSSGGPLKAYIRAGNILNDTTFVITESYRMHKGKKTEEKVRNETYHFRQFSPKPDSTNSFIK